jgi:hypothetical protein
MKSEGLSLSAEVYRLESRLIKFFFTVLLFVSFGFLVYLVKNIPLNWDEAYNFQVILTKLAKGAYGTANDNFQNIHLYNPQITTGPAVLLPIYYINKLFGFGIGRSRFIITLFCFASCVLLFVIFSTPRLKKQCIQFLPSIIGACSLFFVPFLKDFGTTILGEVPAAMYILCSCATLLFWSECVLNGSSNSTAYKGIFWLILSGIAGGLAVLSKYQFLIFLPALFIEMAYVLCIHLYRDGFLKTLPIGLVSYFVLASALSLIPIFFIYVLYTTAGFEGLKNTSDFFTLFSGNTRINSVEVISQRLTYIYTLIKVPLYFWIAVVLLNPFKIPLVFTSPYRLLNCMAFGWILWFVVYSKSGWGRHVFPGLMILIPAVSAQMTALSLSFSQATLSSRFNIIKSSLSLLLAIMPCFYGGWQLLTFNPYTIDYSDSFPGELAATKKLGSYTEWQSAELAAAQYIQLLPAETRICSDGYFRDFKLETILHRNFCTLTGEDLKRSDVVIIFNKLEQLYFSEDHYQKRLQWHRDVSKREVDIQGYKFFFTW